MKGNWGLGKLELIEEVNG